MSLRTSQTLQQLHGSRPVRALATSVQAHRALYSSAATVAALTMGLLTYRLAAEGTPALEPEIAGVESDAGLPEPAEPPAAGAPAGPERITPAARPDVIKGLYLNAWAAGSPRKLEKLLGLADQTEINTFVIDVKEGGHVSYRSAVAEVKAAGADAEYIKDIRGVLSKLRARGIYPIARIVCFKDPVLAAARPDLAVQDTFGGIWKDNKGVPWVDSFDLAVWNYNIAIAREAIELGFAEVQWDYVRFPDVPKAYMNRAVWPARNGRTKAQGIRDFLLYSRERLADLGVPVTADVFGLSVSERGDVGIGQRWEMMVDATDVLLPMVYPSHFARGTYGIGYPNEHPYETVKTAMLWAQKRSAGVARAATIRPWLQVFTLGPPRYGPAHARAQIKAVYDAGLSEWILWHPGSQYDLYVPALAKEGGPDPDLPIPGRIPGFGKKDVARPPDADSARPSAGDDH